MKFGGALLLPMISQALEKARSHRLSAFIWKQLNLAWQMYADESSGILASNDVDFRAAGAVESAPNSWVTGNAGLDTNTTTITDGSIYPYVKNIQCYRYRADHSFVLEDDHSDLRTCSLSCFIGGSQSDTEEYGVKPLHQMNRPQSIPIADIY